MNRHLESQLTGACNPFSTRFVRPGALPYHFSEGHSTETFRLQLRADGWQGQIVGPHGSGKTTLLRTLDHHWTAWGREVVTVTLRNQQRRLPLTDHHARRWHVGTQVVVDGYEQLGWASRLWLRRHCRNARCGLLATAHRPVRLPLTFRSETSLELADELVRQLCRQAGQRTAFRRDFAGVDIRRAFEQARGNLRETFCLLYDRCS